MEIVNITKYLHFDKTFAPYLEAKLSRYTVLNDDGIDCINDKMQPYGLLCITSLMKSEIFKLYIGTNFVISFMMVSKFSTKVLILVLIQG